MKVNNIVLYALLLLVLNFMCVIDGKKILLGVIGLHALRRLHGIQHMHNLVSIYLPLRYAADAWKSYGKTSGAAPHLPYAAIAGHQIDFKSPKTVKLSAEQAYELDKWINHYYPIDHIHGFDHNFL